VAISWASTAASCASLSPRSIGRSPTCHSLLVGAPHTGNALKSRPVGARDARASRGNARRRRRATRCPAKRWPARFGVFAAGRKVLLAQSSTAARVHLSTTGPPRRCPVSGPREPRRDIPGGTAPRASLGAQAGQPAKAEKMPGASFFSRPENWNNCSSSEFTVSAALSGFHQFGRRAARAAGGLNHSTLAVY